MVDQVHVASAAQRVLIGGAVQLFDLETGEPITIPMHMIGIAEGGGGIIGAIVDANRSDPFNRAALTFATTTRKRLLATSEVEIPFKPKDPSELSVPAPTEAELIKPLPEPVEEPQS